ncbi:MAG: efflux RND transporter periplasmic adaptor subunit [Terriglobales bacterium]
MISGKARRIPAPAWLVVAAALTSLATGCGRAAAPEAAPPTPVVVVAAAERAVTLASEWVATLDGYVDANIQPEVSGYIVRQDFKEGQAVRKGEVLFEIDPRPFQAVLDEAQGKLAEARGQVTQATAQVAEARAQLGAAVLNVKRDEPEAAAHAIAQSQLENDTQGKLAAEAAVTAAEASVTADRAGVEAAEAAVEQAQLNVGFTQVRSLIDGVAGIAQVQIGNLVAPQTVLTTVSQLNPIKAYFAVPSSAYQHSVSGAAGAVNLLAPGAPPLELVLGDGTVFAQRGRVLFANRQVDSDTGTIRLAAAFPNPGNQLRPGETARVRAVTERLPHALVVPQTAVSQLQGAYQVDVVDAGNVVHVRPVSVGATSGADWIITAGLQAGERVVTEGTEKLHDGSRVRPQAPEPEPASANPATSGN